MMVEPTQVEGKRLPCPPFRVLNDRVLILRDEPFKKSPTGLLYIPDSATSDRCEGIVVSVGPGRQPWSKKGIIPPSLRRGQRVFWSQHASVRAGQKFFDMHFKEKGDERAYVLMREEDCIGVVVDGRPEALFGWVIVERPLPDEMTKGGIYIPDQAKEKKNEGTIWSVGPGPWNDRGTERLRMFARSIPPGKKVAWPDYMPKEHEPLQRYARKGHELVVVMDEHIECWIDEEPVYDPI
jgi:co-chaperonin GroES (HSP10)